MDPLTAISTRRTPQNAPADPTQVQNSAGGYTFRIGDDALVHRFLVLGTTGGTYYSTEADLTADTTGVVLAAARADASSLVRQIVDVSTAGRAPKQDPAIFALAAASALGDKDGRAAALDALPAVCRTGTHLFKWAGYREQFGGWGRGTRRAVSSWYTDRPTDQVAYQAVKYRQREGWSHRDLLRLAHPRTTEIGRRALFQWVTKGGHVDDVPPLVAAFREAQAATTVTAWRRLIEQHGLTWEMLPDAALNEPDVWRALIHKGIPQTALIRQLPRLTRLGVLAPMGHGDTAKVAEQLADPSRLKAGRVHPVNVLVALRTYASGKGAKGKETWTPVARIVDALDAAFYAAFGAVAPAGKRTLVAVDVSASMDWTQSGLPLSCREAAAALALVTVSTEPDAGTVGFSHRIEPLLISPRQRLDDVMKTMKDLPMGGTDCAQPMLFAAANRLKVDTFITITDNETWAGRVHPHQALEAYRQQSGIAARHAVVALAPTRFSIADPRDPGQLDVAGLDSAVPNMLADFSRGDI